MPVQGKMAGTNQIFEQKGSPYFARNMKKLMFAWMFAPNIHSKEIMNRLLLFVAVFALISCNSNSNSEIPLSTDLVQLEKDFTRAIKERDRATLDKVVTPEFTVTGVKYIDSAAVTRSVWMTNVLQDLKIDSAHFISIKANTVDNVGIVRAQFYWSGTYADQHFSDTTSFVDTWIKRSGDWRIVSRVVADK